MPAMLDVLFSMMLGFVIIMIILNANVVVGEGWFMFNGEYMVQQMLISTATLIEGEFRNMGFGVDKEPTNNTGVVLLADSTRIVFASDLGRTGTLNEIEYVLGSTDDVSYQNERIRPLYRQVDSGDKDIVGMVTHFRLRYFNREGNELNVPVASPGNVHLIEIEMEVQNPYALYRDPGDILENDPSEIYATSMWRQTRLGSKNFQTR